MQQTTREFPGKTPSEVFIYVTEFVKRDLIHASNLMTFKRHNFIKSVLLGQIFSSISAMIGQSCFQISKVIGQTQAELITLKLKNWMHV